MGGSLQDQLLKAGLVDSQKARQARTEKRKQGRQQHGGAADADRLAAQQALAEKAERDRELNRRRQEEARRKALAAEITELVRVHRIPREGGDRPYNFTDGKLVKRIYVTEAQQRQLANGQLAIVRQGDGYELVSAEVAERIRAREGASLVLLNPAKTRDEEDEAYAEYKVPDDLIW